MLLIGRANFTISFLSTVRKICKNKKMNCDSLVVLEYPDLKERNWIYLALSKNTDKKPRDEFVSAFSNFQGSKTYLDILDKDGLKFIDN